MIDKLSDFIAGLAPWLAPVPTAWLVGSASVRWLAWPLPVAICAALVIESLGMTATQTALTLYEYNQAKRKTDPAAPFALAASLVIVYVVVVVGLTVALDVWPGAARFAPVLFPGLSLTGVTLLALRSDHRRRLATIAGEKAERKAERAARREAKQAKAVKGLSNDVKLHALDRMQEARRLKLEKRLDALLDACSGNPDLSIADAAKLLQVSRQTVYSYVDTLEAAGRLSKNGNGWEVF